MPVGAADFHAPHTSQHGTGAMLGYERRQELQLRGAATAVASAASAAAGASGFRQHRQHNSQHHAAAGSIGNRFGGNRHSGCSQRLQLPHQVRGHQHFVPYRSSSIEAPWEAGGSCAWDTMGSWETDQQQLPGQMPHQGGAPAGIPPILSTAPTARMASPTASCHGEASPSSCRCPVGDWTPQGDWSPTGEWMLHLQEGPQEWRQQQQQQPPATHTSPLGGPPGCWQHPPFKPFPSGQAIWKQHAKAGADERHMSPAASTKKEWRSDSPATPQGDKTLLSSPTAAPSAGSSHQNGLGSPNAASPSRFPVPPIPVRNTFLDSPVQRSPSLERFLGERKVRSTPVSRQNSGGLPGEEDGGQEAEEKEVQLEEAEVEDPFTIATPTGSVISTPRGPLGHVPPFMQPGVHMGGSFRPSDATASSAAASLAAALAGGAAVAAVQRWGIAPGRDLTTEDSGSTAGSLRGVGAGSAAGSTTAESIAGGPVAPPRSQPGSGDVPGAEAVRRSFPVEFDAPDASFSARGALTAPPHEGSSLCGSGGGSVALPPAAMAVASEDGELRRSEGGTWWTSEGEVPNRGSAVHRWGACKPCAFVHKGGCETGVDCQFCHLCEPGEKKRRKKERRVVRREGHEELRWRKPQQEVWTVRTRTHA